MRRVPGYELLMSAVAVVVMAGCSGSSSPDVADAGGPTEAPGNVAVADWGKSANRVAGEPSGEPARLASSAAPPAAAEIADGADSDAPGRYRSPARKSAPEQQNTPIPASKDGEAAKGNERNADGDDPEAPRLIAKVAEQQDDSQLDNGREPSAQPIPEAERGAVETKVVAPEALSDGRTPGAQPGDEVARPDPAIAKPAAPSRATLADLSESIQILDKDSDGQIGLYEWPREKLADLQALDANKDGFLTPAELRAEKQPGAKTQGGDVENPPADQPRPENTKEKNTEEKQQPKEKETEQAKDKEATATATSSDEKAPAPEDQKTPDAPADGAANQDDSSPDTKPTQGS